ELRFARKLLRKRRGLWQKNIGTEIEFLETKNRVENLEKRLRVLRAQLGQAIIVAPFSGIVDWVNVRVGEQVMPGSSDPLLRLSSPEGVHVYAEISDKYIGRIEVADTVRISPLGVGENLLFSSVQTQVQFISQTLDPNSRTFFIKSYLPSESSSARDLFLPNQVVEVRIQDYYLDASFVLPSHLIQYRKTGTYLYKVIPKTSGDRKGFVAERVRVVVGKTYKNLTQILEGVDSGDLIIYEGYKNISRGWWVKIVRRVDVSEFQKI
ncbi:MAG: efflux RND transporter periplasmic adaptor subunit, partial [Cytophagales bacterium]|nr:efflux RND transporter periplasmic adaptor subunit [Cytophagales bacterium]